MNKHVILNPAPALPIPSSVYQEIDTLILNETEARLLDSSVAGCSSGESTFAELASRFLAYGVRDAVIITLGASGAVYATATGEKGAVPAKSVKVIDTTAAGDTFLGAYTAHRAREKFDDRNINNALKFATAAAAKTVQRMGAMNAIPFLRELGPNN